MKKIMSLRNRFILTSYLSIVVSIVLISVVSYILLSSNSKRFALQSNQDIASQKKENVNLRIEEMESAIRDIIYRPEMQRILGEQELGGSNGYLVRTSVNHAISGSSNSLYMMDNIAVFNVEGSMIGSMFEFDSMKSAQDYDWYEEAFQSQGDTLWLYDTLEKVRDNYGYHMTMGAVKKIRSVYTTGSANIGGDLGYIFLRMNLDKILNFSQSDYASQGRVVLVVDENHRIIGGSEPLLYGEPFQGNLKPEYNNQYVNYEGRQHLLTYTEVDSFPKWTIICLTGKSYILKDAYMAIAICFAVSLVLLVVFWFLSLRNANTLSKPIELLEQNFEMVERGDFDIRIHGHTKISEINSLFSRFHVMVYRLDTLIHEVYEAKIKEQKLVMDARQAQLTSLQMQINPHFLYNTLDSINWMALIQGNEEVSRMIIALGRLFRNNMNTSGIYTTVEEEIENVKLYMYLEQVRFEGRLTYALEVQEGAVHGVILKYILQPLVENSIKYGIEPYPIKGEVQISIYREKENLVIDVRDNGKGMAAEKLREIRHLWDEIGKPGQLASGEQGKSRPGGVGLRNIMKRLYLCYGEKAVFSIESSADQGTETRIVFPFSTAENTSDFVD